jgi:hypothetical protein
MDVVLTDIVGNVWGARYVITPPPGSSGDICHTPASPAVELEPIWPVRIAALNDDADLALIKINLEHGPIAFLDMQTAAPLVWGDPVYAFGFPGDGGFAMRRGVFVRTCEGRFLPVPRIADMLGGIQRITVEVLTRFMLDAKPGMSGGPIVAGSRVVGIVSSAGSHQSAEVPEGPTSLDLTFGVPADYAHAWYLWIRGQLSERPKIVCEKVIDYSEPVPSR